MIMCCSGNVAQSLQHMNISHINGKVIDAHMNMRLPWSEITHESAIGVHLQSCVQTWAETVGVPTSTVLQVYWLDFVFFSTLGYHFNRSALTTLSKMSESMALNPEYCAGIILTQIQVPLDMSTLKRGSANL